MRWFTAMTAAIMGWYARQSGEDQVDRLQRLLTAAVLLLFPSACLLVDRSDSVSLLLLAIVGLCVWIRNGFRSGLTRRDWLYVAVFAGFFVAGVLAFEFGHQTDAGFRLLGRYIRFLFVLPVLLALRRYRPPAPVVWAGLGLGALILGCDAVWESLDASGFLRPDGDTNVAILFGDLATLTTCAFAAGYIYIDERLPRSGPFLVTGCILMGLLASFLSGTRGAWVALPVLLVLFLFCRHMLRPRIVLVGAGSMAALFIALVLLPQTHILQRVESMELQLKTYWAVTQGGGRSSATPQCFDNAHALQAWISSGDTKYPKSFNISVTGSSGIDVASLANYACSQGAAVHLHNPSNGYAWVRLPRSGRGSSGMASTRLLVRGKGSIGFAEQLHGEHRIDTVFYGALDMRAPARYGFGLSIIVPAGDDLWIVPVESYFGEYRYAVLQGPVGQRLEMWWASLRLFYESPVFGKGTGAYQVETQRLVAAGKAAPDTADFDHPHSDYFDALSSRGLVGLLAFLLLLGVPAWLYMANLDSRDPHRMGAALGGLLVAVGFAIFGLTETMFIHSVTIGWYVIMTAVFLVSADAPGGQWTDKR
ncbi:MAG: O-antigen ligase family protein [Gammaproteobacteria bacterium]